MRRFSKGVKIRSRSESYIGARLEEREGRRSGMQVVLGVRE